MLVILSVLSCFAFAADASWNKIRYQGGTIDAKVNPFDWNTTLKVSSTEIELMFAGRKKVTIKSGNVIALAQGEKAYRLISDAIGVNSVPNPVQLFGIVPMGKEHLVGIAFRNVDGGHGAVLFSVHKDSYRELLRALSTLTGRPVENAP